MNDTAAARFRRSAAHLSTVVDAVSDWSVPSPCTGWSAGDVLQHVVDTQSDLLARMPFGAPADTTDPVAAWPVTRDAIQAALDDPQQAGHTYDSHFGPTTFAATVDTFYSMDVMVHGWDIARAAGLTDLEQLDADDVATAMAGLDAVGDSVRMPGIFGPAVEIDAGASAQDRFLAWTGRDPRR